MSDPIKDVDKMLQRLCQWADEYARSAESLSHSSILHAPMESTSHRNIAQAMRAAAGNLNGAKREMEKIWM